MKNYKHIFGSLIAIAFVVSVLVFGAAQVQANPEFFIRSEPTAAATSTLAYVMPGKATSTLLIDTQNGGTSPYGATGATLVFQVTATTTGPNNPVVKVRFEDSMDGIDWYARVREAAFPTSQASGQATSTNVTSDPYAEYSFKVASSSTALGGSSSTTTLAYSLTVETPLRYVRAVLYNPIGGGNYGLWAQLFGRKEQNN